MIGCMIQMMIRLMIQSTVDSIKSFPLRISFIHIILIHIEEKKMSNSYALMYFVFLMVSVSFWMYMSNKLFKMLKNRHPEIYKSMNRPDVILNNSPNTGIKLMNFISNRKHKTLNDKELSRLSDFMLIYFFLYIIAIIIFIFVIPSIVQ